MILLSLTREQAMAVAEALPDLRDKIQSDLRMDAGIDGTPRTVLYRDMGDGLVAAAVAFYDSDAADRAAEALWKETVRQSRPIAEGQGKLFKR